MSVCMDLTSYARATKTIEPSPVFSNSQDHMMIILTATLDSCIVLSSRRLRSEYIVQCAAARGIDVMMEIDTRGHAAIIVATYIDYAESFDASQWTNFTNEPPAGQRRFAFSEVMNFAASLLIDVAKILPS
ncbi:uncharacterized protein HD556DRAFT_1451510 [Suillus plorans]|uniref:beta-N-acetylhexosaminidase n=1 Tax=Suillus plorans TaxID=116603 RepID=A0A9P7DA53_9AGAM|nr:uncharacterized protein HD556DRAFT_1451510 [Suillus plorans]KAG1784668.1 hypothetical protein HD556DRAFT_1451510 [Suillus plorans]